MTDNVSEPFAELAGRRLSVAWRFEDRDGATKKMPINPATGYGAKANDSGTWNTRAAAEACAQARGLSGIGINLSDLGDGTALVGIDLDTCRDPVCGTFAPWAQQVIDRFAAYTEVSPSGCGAKIFFRLLIDDRDELLAEIRAASDDETKAGTKWVVGEAGGDHPPAAELYLAKRYFTVRAAG
jgi:putative DNA primase/helicase